MFRIVSKLIFLAAMACVSPAQGNMACYSLFSKQDIVVLRSHLIQHVDEIMGFVVRVNQQTIQHGEATVFPFYGRAEVEGILRQDQRQLSRVIYENGKLVGIALFEWVQLDQRLILRKLAVDQERSGRGLSRLVLKAALDSGYEIVLSARQSMAENFYSRLGFKIIEPPNDMTSRDGAVFLLRAAH